MIYTSLAVLMIIGLFIYSDWLGIREAMEAMDDYEHDVNEDTNLIQKGE
jgi:hypothetical protein